MGTFLEIATPLIQRGIPVIPVQPNEKRCLLPEWQKKATTDIEQIKLWDGENPHFNVGCVGKPDGFVMLDCDLIGLRERIEEETKRKFPVTLIVMSAGKGAEHIYFRQTDRSRGLGNRSSAGIFDLQSVDKYVVGAGSTLANGKTYEIVQESPIAEFPDWLADWVERNCDVRKENHGGKGAPVHEDFDFDHFCDHFDFTFVGDEKDGKHLFEACPYKGDHHTNERGQPDYPACCMFYDGETLGFSDLAASCAGYGKTIHDLIRFRYQQGYEEYDGEIFEPIEELLETFGITVEEALETHPCIQCGEPLTEGWRIVCDECSENAKSDETVCYDIGCNCKKRHPRLEEGESFIKEYEERKAQADDLNTIKVIEPVEGDAGEVVLASGETEKHIVVSLGGVLASEVETMELKWLWPDRIPAGKPSLFTGKSDNGKSMCLLDVIARTTTGRDWPDGSKNMLGARRVLLATSEDDPSDTLVPRLQAAGADLTKVVLVTVTKQGKGQPKSKRMLKLKEDAKLLEKALVANPDVALVALDPMSSFFGTEGGLNKDESVRPIMDSIANTLRKTGATLIGIVHTNKRSDVDALEKVLGAGSLVQSSRSVWGFSRDPEVDNEFYMALLKNNLTKKRGGMKYRISEKKIKLTSGAEVLSPHIEWIGEHDQSANDLLDKERKLRKEGGKDGLLAEASQKELAKKFLLDNLRRGSDKIGELLDLAVDGGISKATFWRAAKELRLESTDVKPKRFLLPRDSKPESTMQDVDAL